MKQKIMLIAGCSHTAGSEIDGTQDSEYNRNFSFGNQLGARLGYKPLNIAEPGSTNSSICRSVLQWFHTEYNSKKQEVFVLVGWTEPMRMEVPWHRPNHYDQMFPHSNWFATTGKNFLRINVNWEGGDPEEKALVRPYHAFISRNEKYLEILSLNTYLQLQFYLKSISINYLFINAHNALPYVKDDYTKFYFDLVDRERFYQFEQNEQAFYDKFKTLGYKNKKAKYMHHDIVPHEMYATELQYFMEKSNVYSKMVQELNKRV